MSAMPLRAYEPAPQLTGADSFRCDDALVAHVLDWYERDTSRSRRSQTAETERRRKWRICRESLGQRRCDDCRPFDLLDLINAQADVRSDWTRKGWNSTIQRPFNHAEKLGLIVKNPFRGLSFPNGGEGRDWTDEELEKIIAGANLEFRRLVLGLRFSGLRPHEGCDLQWPHILPTLIKIEKHKTRYRTKKARIVPLNEPLKKLFDCIRTEGRPGTHVFLNTKGRPWTRTHADSTFRRLREKLGLPDDLKLHGCRHTFATQALLNGVGVAQVMAFLGHSDMRTTQKYTHMTNKVDHLTDAMNQAVAPKAGAALATGERRNEPHPTPLFDGLG